MYVPRQNTAKHACRATGFLPRRVLIGPRQVGKTTVARYLDLLVQTMMVRRLEPVHVNLGKRLVKSPKVYLRDSGMLNMMLSIRTLDDLYGHPAAGAELDLVVTSGQRRIAVEAKFSTAPRPTRGFWHALDDLEIEHAWIVAAVDQGYRLDERVDVIPVHEI